MTVSEDKEFKETSQNALKKFETPMVPSMLYKTSKDSQHGATRVKFNEIKFKLACILEANESKRLRMGNSFRNHHEDPIEGEKSLHQYNLCSQIYSYASSFENSCSKSSGGQEMGKLV